MCYHIIITLKKELFMKRNDYMNTSDAYSYCGIDLSKIKISQTPKTKKVKTPLMEPVRF